MKMKIVWSFLVTAGVALVTACGGGAGGGGGIAGIGGTGVTYGPVTGFGSVIVNGVEYVTSAADFSVEGSSAGIDQNDLDVGMVVTVTHDDNDNAKSISYQDNAEGPVANLNAPGNTFDVLGVGITVDSLTVYDGLTDVNVDGAIDINDLANDDIVEISGHITAASAVLATRVEYKATCSTLGAGEEIEVKGTVSNVDTIADTFDVGSLTVNANGLMPIGLANGDYVEVKSGTCPSPNLSATSIDNETEGADLSDLDAGEDGMELKGVIANAAGSAPNCSFDIDGQAVRTTSGTDIEGNLSCATLVDGDTVKVEGQLNAGGTLVADQINREDSEADVDSEFSGLVTVVSQTSSFNGVITVNGSANIAVDIATAFHGDSQSFNLDTLAAGTLCAEVKTDATMRAISIDEEDCN
ncbi:MAG: hypothetical protein HZB57_08480 [Gammaproteobacteria bacterium]|nr:hypothetical protein [Gammaproteobacteria bacterium]